MFLFTVLTCNIFRGAFNRGGVYKGGAFIIILKYFGGRLLDKGRLFGRGRLIGHLRYLEFIFHFKSSFEYYY